MAEPEEAKTLSALLARPHAEISSIGGTAARGGAVGSAAPTWLGLGLGLELGIGLRLELGLGVGAHLLGPDGRASDGAVRDLVRVRIRVRARVRVKGKVKVRVRVRVRVRVMSW